MHQRQRPNQSISHYCSTSSALFPSQHFLHGHSPNNLRTWFAKKRGFSEVKSRKFVIEQTPHSLPSNLFGGHVGKIEQNHKKSSKFSPPGQNPQDKRYQRYFLINIHLTAVSEGVNCIWLLWGWTSLRESCQLSDLHKSDSLARGITLILLGSSTKHSSFFYSSTFGYLIVYMLKEIGLLQMFSWWKVPTLPRSSERQKLPDILPNLIASSNETAKSLSWAWCWWMHSATHKLQFLNRGVITYNI